MLNERVRYFPGPVLRKNTLVTLSDGKTIYFGIARCNLAAGDNMKKSHGRMIAKARALRAKAENVEMPEDMASEGFITHENGLRGFCAVENVQELLRYFENIDQIMYDDAVESRNSDVATN